jgi:hypothetical protein
MRKELSPEQLQHEIARQAEQLAKLRRKVFGESMERRPSPEPPGGESGKKPQRGHGPTPQMKLPTREVHHRLADNERECPACKGMLEEMGEHTEDTEEITVEKNCAVWTPRVADEPGIQDRVRALAMVRDVTELRWIESRMLHSQNSRAWAYWPGASPTTSTASWSGSSATSAWCAASCRSARRPRATSKTPRSPRRGPRTCADAGLRGLADATQIRQGSRCCPARGRSRWRRAGSAPCACACHACCGETPNPVIDPC